MSLSENSPPATPNAAATPEFMAWLKQPGNALWFFKNLKLDDPHRFDTLPPEIQRAAWATLESHRTEVRLDAVRAKFEAMALVFNVPPKILDWPTKLAKCSDLLDEASDALLDVSEPHRTIHFQALLSLQDDLRKLRAKRR